MVDRGEKKSWVSARSVASLSLLLVACGAIYSYLSANREPLHLLRNISFAQAALLVTLRILYMGTYGLFLKISTAKFHIRLDAREWFGLPFITSLGNQLTPFAGGVIVRAVYLKRRHALPYATFTSLLAANHVMTVWAAGLTGLLTCMLFSDLGPWRWAMTVFFSLVVGMITLIVSLPRFSLPGHGRFIRTANSVLEGWSLVKGDRTLLVRAALIALAGIVLNGLSFRLAYLAIGVMVRPQAAVILSLLPFFLVFLAITPGNLGVQEIVISLTSALLGGGVGKGLMVALLIRAATLIPACVLGVVFGLSLYRDPGSSRAGPPDDAPAAVK